MRCANLALRPSGLALRPPAWPPSKLSRRAEQCVCVVPQLLLVRALSIPKLKVNTVSLLSKVKRQPLRGATGYAP